MVWEWAKSGQWGQVWNHDDLNPYLHAQDKSGRTLLHYAALSGDVSVIRRLVGLEVTGSLVDGQGHSALLLAASQGHLEAVKIIREAPETDLCAADAFGRTLTHWAAKWGWNDLIRQIGSVNAVTTGGDSPLHWAALEGRLDTVETLLELGADPRIKNNRGESPGDLCANIDVKESIQRSLDKFVSEEATKVSVDLVKPTKAKALNLSSAPKRQKLKFKLRTN